MSSELREGGESSWRTESRKAVEGGWRMLIKLCWDQLQKQKQSGVPTEDKTKIFLLWEQILSTYNLNSLCPKSTWALLATSTSGSPSEGQSNFYLKYFLNASSCPQPLSQPCYHYQPAKLPATWTLAPSRSLSNSADEVVAWTSQLLTSHPCQSN